MTSPAVPDAANFLAELAHDLRNLLEGMDATLSGELADPSLRSVVYREIYDLILKTEGYLDRRTIEEGRVELRAEPVDLRVSVESALRRLAPYLQERKLGYAAGSGEAVSRCDRRWLAKALDHVLHASAKLTRPGDEIDLSLKAEDDVVRLEIHLPGTFVETRMRENLFSSGDSGSWALGAWRELVRLMGGELDWVRARGARLGLALPRAAEMRVESDVAAREPTARPRILVVDDRDDAARSLAMLLSLAGYETEVCGTGRKAIAAFRKLRPGVVLLDLGLPDIDGYEVCRALREEPGGAEALLVAVSGRYDAEASRRGGFDAHLLKPVAKDELLRAVASGREAGRRESTTDD